ncbi:hypothetical protein [Dyadobacter sp. CY312]|uniref:hypothetical protein n=1 Tax=Dyadobacter sp. CY312 TaxID=2907303 RepID=UPI001F262170|nr:hypothetical protein [Dyadobacter sp. CY312]MCE7040113.1 hypothetical protein [Dyadobacter sp. CY312]
MIQFSFDWGSVLNQIILAFAVLLLPVQLWLLVFRGKPGFSGRLAVRTGLNLILWMAVLAFILQPFIRREQASGVGLLVGDDVSSSFKEKLTDSLAKAEMLDLSETNDVENLSVIDTFLIAGQDFKPGVFQSLLTSEHRPVLKWIPFYNENKARSLSWKGILRKGEMQVLRGEISSRKDQILSVRYGAQVLDSIKLSTGGNSFKFSFPVFTEGRAAITLNLAGTTLDTIRYFSRPAESLTFRFIQDNPDFESRNLATWLGKNGHSVLYTTTLSKDIQSQQLINKAKDPDIVVTDPGNASHAVVKKAQAAGKSVLFINLTNPVTEISRINMAMGTKLAVRKTSSQETVSVLPGLSALPYQFAESGQYMSVDKYPVAVERMKGSIGVSMLSETFPLMLAGDSVTYQNVWSRIIAAVRPASGDNLEVVSPIYQDVQSELKLNNFSKKPEIMLMGGDTIFLNHSALNASSSVANFRATQVGWLTLSDSLNSEMYIEKASSGLNAARMKDFVRSYTFAQDQSRHSVTDTVVSQGVKKKLPDWAWLVILVFCFTAVWIENKL